jgi:hypothetical protein
MAENFVYAIALNFAYKKSGHPLFLYILIEFIS